jgi:hypothetical protein
MATKQKSKEKRAKRKVRMGFPRKVLLLCSLLTAHCSLLIAQDEGRSVQRLSWTGDEYTRRYEIIIEKEEVGEYRELLREFTRALFIDVSLSPGKYRCLVITYDFLNRPGGGSGWMYIEVLAHPDSDDMLPEFFLSDSDSGSLVDKSEDNEPAYKVEMFLSAAWMPSFTIYDKGNRFFGQDNSLAGVTGGFGLLWDKPYYFNPGAELEASYSFFDADSGGQTHLLTFALNLLLLRRLPEGNLDPSGSRRRVPGEAMALTFRLGAGYNVLLPQGGAAHINMGLSFLLFVTDNWYLETGLGYAYWFSDPPANIFRPWIGIGWRF